MQEGPFNGRHWVFCCLSTESSPVWWFWLRQRWAGPVWQWRTEPSSKCRGLGSAIAAVSGLYTAAPLWASVDKRTLDKTSSNHPSVSSHHRPTLAPQHGTLLLPWGVPASTLRLWQVVGSSVDLIQVTLRHPSCPDMGDSGSLWHWIRCRFKFNRVHFVGKVVTAVTLAAVPVQQKPFHRCTGAHKIPQPSSFKKH